MKTAADSAESSLSKMTTKIGTAAIAVGGAMTAAGATLEHFSGAAEQANARLKTAISNTGNDFVDFREQIDKAGKQMEHFGHTNADTEQALGTLTTALQDPNAALKDMALVANLAAYKHISLADAATMVAKAHGGAGRIFKEFGVQVQTNAAGIKDYDAALAEVGQRLEGQASAQADTFSGHMAALRAEVGDVAAKIGEKLVPVLVIGGPALTGIGSAATLTQGKMTALKGALTETEGGLSKLGKAAVVAGGLLAAAAIAETIINIHNSAQKMTFDVEQLAKVSGQGLVQAFDMANTHSAKLVDGNKEFDKAISQNIGTLQAFVDELQREGRTAEASKYNSILKDRIKQEQIAANRAGATTLATDKQTSSTLLLGSATRKWLDDLLAAGKEGARELDALNSAIEASKNAQQELNDKVSNYDDLLRRVTDKTDTLRGKDEDWNSALLDLKDSVEKNGPVWDIWTRKGIENNNMLDAMETSVGAVIGKLGDKWKGNVDKFVSESKRFTDEAYNNAQALGAPADVLERIASDLDALIANEEINIRVNATVYTRQQLNDIGAADPVLAAQILGLPTHASGGLVTSPQIALIGEAGPEMIVPLNGSRSSGGSSGAMQTIVVQLDSKTIASAVVKHSQFAGGLPIRIRAAS